MEKENSLNEALKKFIEIQTELNKEKLEEIKKNNNEIELLNKQVKESYGNLMSLDKDTFINKIIETLDEESRRGWEHSEEIRAYLFNNKNIDLDLLFLRLSHLREDVFGKKRKMKIDIDAYISYINKRIKEYKKDQEEENIEEKSQKIFIIAKEEGLLSMNRITLDRICLEKGIILLKRNRPLVVEMVKNKLLRDIVNKNEKNPLRISIPKDVREKVFERDGNKCKLCGDMDYLEVGHKIPISKGGDNKPSNLITLCRKCNSKVGVNVVLG